MKKLFILCALCLLFSCASTKPLSQERVEFYNEIADEVNLQCPITLDEVSVLAKLEFSEKDRALVYIYSVLMEKEEESEVTWSAIKETMANNLDAQAAANANQPIYVLCRKDQLNIKHIFYDKNGKELFNLTQAYGSY